MDAKDAVFAANEAFYRAFERRDLTAMRDVWTGSAYDVCIHPGWDISRGWGEIRRTWQEIFANPGPMEVVVEQVSVDVWADVGRVVLIENVWADAQLIGRVAATNLFVRTPDGWRLTLHHGSPIANEATEPDAEGDAFN